MKTIDTIIVDPDGMRFLPPHASFVRRIVVVIRSVLGWLDHLADRRRSRMALLEMTDEQLKDIGVSRADAYREGIRPPWD